MINIEGKSMVELSTMVKEGEVSILDMIQTYIARIENYDKGPNGYNSILEINPDALSLAEEMDIELKNNKTEEKSLLYGMPIMLKDNIGTADKLHTSAGSLALQDLIMEEDAAIVQVLRKNGAIILGKANMTEFANYMTQHMPGGYSSRGGQVYSPYIRGEDPSGSSTGSAVAVTMDLCAAAFGTDTSNSVVGASHRNGIVGFKPSHQTFSQKGIIPISFTLDSAGPMTRTVKDAIFLFEIITGQKVPLSDMNHVSGLKIGINIWGREGLSEEANKYLDNMCNKLKKEGAHLFELNIPDSNNVKKIMRYEFKYSMNNFLKNTPISNQIRSLKDIIAYNEAHPEETLRFGQSYLTDAQDNTSGVLNEPEYNDIMQDRERRKEDVKKQLEGLDACILCAATSINHYLGLPSISIPHGVDSSGMPSGFILTSLEDVRLLQTAYLFEKLCTRVGPKI